MINFPDAPTTNQLFTAAGATWRWDSTKWVAWSAAIAGDITSVNVGTGLSGGGTSGDVTVSLTTPVVVANGGTGQTSLTQNAALVGNGTTAITASTAMTIRNGVNIGTAAADPGVGALTINANAAALPAPYPGIATLLRAGAADGQATTFLTDAFGSSSVWMARASGGTAAAPTVTASGANILGIQGYGWNGSAYVNTAAFNFVSSGTWSASSTPSDMQFYTTVAGATGSIMRMYLRAGLVLNNAAGAAPTGGDLGPGTINAAGSITSGGNTLTVRAGGTGGYVQLNTGDGTNAGYVAFYNPSGTRQGYVGFNNTGIIFAADTGNLVFNSTGLPNATNAQSWGNGSFGWAQVAAYAFPNLSDRKYKADIESLPAGCLDLVRGIEPKRFRFTNGHEAEQRRVQWGFIADEVGGAMRAAGYDGDKFAGFIDGDAEGSSQMLNYANLTAILWKACQELKAELDALRASLPPIQGGRNGKR